MLSQREIALFEKIAQIVENAWQNDDNEGCENYEEALPQLFSLRENRASVEAIAHKLFQLQRKRSKFEPSLAACRMVAERIATLE